MLSVVIVLSIVAGLAVGVIAGYLYDRRGMDKET